MSKTVLSFSDRVERAKAEGRRLAKAEYDAKQAELKKLEGKKGAEALDYEENPNDGQVTNPKDNDPHVKSRSSLSFKERVEMAKKRGKRLAEVEHQAKVARMAELDPSSVSQKKK